MPKVVTTKKKKKNDSNDTTINTKPLTHYFTTKNNNKQQNTLSAILTQDIINSSNHSNLIKENEKVILNDVENNKEVDCDNLETRMYRVLRTKFKLQEFRGIQKDIIKFTLEKKDCLVLMPTGGGKSLTYQLPAIMDRGTTLVISPLLALIQNQVDALQTLGIQAASMNSSIKKSVRAAIQQDLDSKEPKIKLLYVTPELMATENFQNSLKSLNDKGFLSRLVIDEAHCISEWGHDFRDDYRKLNFFKETFPKLPVIALTATATPAVQKDILKSLNLPDNTQIFQSSFRRPNLHYEVRFKPSESNNAYSDIVSFIKSIYRNRQKRIESSTITERVEGVCGIIYCATRSTCDDVSQSLRNDGIKAKSYHAGLTNKMREAILKTWSSTTSFSTLPPENDTENEKSDNGKTDSNTKGKSKTDVDEKELIDVVVATISFGMGIDKKDVRFVIHWDMPKTLEGYYQESGRAGRDGMLSRCILYYSRQDRDRITYLLSCKMSEEESYGHGKNNLNEVTIESFNEIVKYCENVTTCRHKFLLEYFGEKVPYSSEKNCPNKRCDICKDQKKVAFVKKQFLLTKHDHHHSDSLEMKSAGFNSEVVRLADGSFATLNKSYNKRQYDDQDIYSSLDSMEDKPSYSFRKFRGNKGFITTTSLVPNTNSFMTATNLSSSMHNKPASSQNFGFQKASQLVSNATSSFNKPNSSGFAKASALLIVNELSKDDKRMYLLGKSTTSTKKQTPKKLSLQKQSIPESFQPKTPKNTYSLDIDLYDRYQSYQRLLNGLSSRNDTNVTNNNAFNNNTLESIDLSNETKALDLECRIYEESKSLFEYKQKIISHAN